MCIRDSPGAVRPQEAEHLAAFHGKRHVEYAAAVAVVFLEPLEFDHGVAHRYSSLMRQEDGVAISSPPVLLDVYKRQARKGGAMVQEIKQVYDLIEESMDAYLSSLTVQDVYKRQPWWA